MKGVFTMKKLICFMITITLLLSTASLAYAKQGGSNDQKGKKQQIQQEASKSTDKVKGNKQKTIKETSKNTDKAYGKKQSFKIDGSPVIKVGKYKVPIKPITKGMGASVDFNKTTLVLTVTKDTTVIVINFKDKTATVNGVADTKSGIFTAKNDKKTNVLLKYIADRLGVRLTISKDKVTVEVPVNNQNVVTVTPVGTSVIANTLNLSTHSLAVVAGITAGQATGGKAELYVESTLVATDAVISATDTSVTFTTSDGTPTNAELQTLIPAGGVITVKLYNATATLLTTMTASAPLVVDYAAPTSAGVTAATYSVSGKAITLTVIGASAINDKVDVSKISLFDTTLNKSYQLTNFATTGSTGVVSIANTILINLGTADVLALTGYGSSTVNLSVAAGSLLSDAAGNTSTEFLAIQTVPVTLVP